MTDQNFGVSKLRTAIMWWEASKMKYIRELVSWHWGFFAPDCTPAHWQERVRTVGPNPCTCTTRYDDQYRDSDRDSKVRDIILHTGKFRVSHFPYRQTWRVCPLCCKAGWITIFNSRGFGGLHVNHYHSPWASMTTHISRRGHGWAGSSVVYRGHFPNSCLRCHRTMNRAAWKRRNLSMPRVPCTVGDKRKAWSWRELRDSSSPSCLLFIFLGKVFPRKERAARHQHSRNGRQWVYAGCSRGTRIPSTSTSTAYYWFTTDLCPIHIPELTMLHHSVIV